MILIIVPEILLNYIETISKLAFAEENIIEISLRKI